MPAIAGLSDSQRRATLAASAIQAEFDLPYGWHALDDGRRTLVFDPQERVRIALSLVAQLEAGDGEPRDELHLLHPWIDESRWLSLERDDFIAQLDAEYRGQARAHA